MENPLKRCGWCGRYFINILGKGDTYITDEEAERIFGKEEMEKAPKDHGPDAGYECGEYE